MSTVVQVVTFLFLGSIIYFLYHGAIGSRKYRRPPGPRGIPLLGNALQLSKNAWVDFEKWKDEHGPLLYLSIFGQPLVILGNSKTAADLLTRRAHKYSDRQRSIVAGEILSGGMQIAFARHGDTWRRQRRAAHEGLHKDVMHVFNSAQALEALILATDLLRDSELWDDHFQKSTASMIMSVTYNLPPLESVNDTGILRIREHMDRLAYALYPGNFLVEFFPWMRHLPPWAAKWQRDAQESFKKDSSFFLKLYHDAVERYKKDEHPSFVAYMVTQNHRHGLSDVEAAWLALTMYGAGAETTLAALQWFMVAMVHHPEVQKKAQAELDSVVGRDRPPSFNDHDHLPYIRALVKEVLRWRPPLPLGLPHRLTEDDWYNGYFLPKGTLCLANVWAINRDTELYGPDACDFNPDRHLDEHGQLLPSLPDFQDESHSSYGFGRRICVGRFIGSASLYIDLATILWATKIEPLVDDRGQNILPDVDNNTNTGLTLHPPPFKCSITPRFPESTDLLEAALVLAGKK